MLNRRILRIKVMQALYGFIQGGQTEIEKKEKELSQSIEKIYDLYLYLLSLLIEVQHFAKLSIEDAKNKKLPSNDDLNPNMKFVENSILSNISSNPLLLKELHTRKISWQNDLDLVRKLFSDIKASEIYKEYMSSESSDPVFQAKFVESIIRNIIGDHELVNHYFEDKNIHWSDDMYIAINGLLKSIQGNNFQLLTLFKDSKEDKQFARDLFMKCAMHSAEFETMISAKTQNWELDRIAFLDVLLMKMALTEVLFFSSIPLKVSLDEYIEISKNYSSQKSKLFINGVLDKIIAELKNENKIVKTGRGLIEN